MATHGLRRFGATVALTIAATAGLSASAASAAPIAGSCGGVATEGQVQTIHDTYTVQKGDTLYRIVRDINASRAAAPQPIATVARQAAALRRANRGTVRNGGNLIFPGQVLRLPEDLRYCTKA